MDGVIDNLAASLAIRKLESDIQLGFGDINSEYGFHDDSLFVFREDSSRNLPCECGLPTGSGQRYCPISRMRIGKTGASSTQQAFPLKGGHGVRSSRSGKPEYYNYTFTIQGWAECNEAQRIR